MGDYKPGSSTTAHRWGEHPVDFYTPEQEARWANYVAALLHDVGVETTLISRELGTTVKENNGGIEDGERN